ncbi:MAG TPA: aminotransferase class I/II-fold pyridoxal phosphate-dependent enzyme, partial [Planctomycetaceae bacterium]|nr:aminotransferase class I/II-fold pyridoxal phosphate-dependent enzyme [Planctomycetaceae bacterium]
PTSLLASAADGSKVELHRLWSRRHSTKFNGASYVVQRGAEACYSPQGKEQLRKTIDFYRSNAARLREGLTALGLKVFGGVDAPYVWLKTPDGLKSWEFFDQLLATANVVGTPGSGFGPSGEGYFRLSAFNSRENVEEALSRLRRVLG